MNKKNCSCLLIFNWHEGGRYEQFLNVMRYDIVMNKNGKGIVLKFVFISGFFLSKKCIFAAEKCKCRWQMIFINRIKKWTRFGFGYSVAEPAGNESF